jgi:hypothetical protein
MAAAWLLTLIAILLTIVRWCYLVRAVGIHLRMKDAMRIGSLGYLFNLAPMGIVGGDLLKAVMLAREYPGHRAPAVASVIIDRVVGLYLLFVVATAGIFLTGFYWQVNVPSVHVLCWVTVLLTAVGTVGLAIVLFSGILESRWIHALHRLPRIGAAVSSLVEALRLYRHNLAVLALASLMTVGVHCLSCVAVYLIARGLPGDVLSLGTHFVVYPISCVASTVPLPAGPFEGTLVFLYVQVGIGKGLAITEGQGLVVALVYRVITVLIAAVGFCYYLRARGEVADVMHEVEEEEDEGHSPWEDTALEP